MIGVYGELHDSWLKAIPLHPCEGCGQPMKVESLTKQKCEACNRGWVSNVYCRHCGTEMDDDGGGYDSIQQADAWAFTCLKCGAEAFTYNYEAVGHIVVDEEGPAA